MRARVEMFMLQSEREKFEGNYMLRRTWLETDREREM